MQKGKAQALREWLQGWEGFEEFTRLNALVQTAGESAVNIVYNDEVKQRYIDGTALRDYTFELLLATDWSAGNDSINVKAQEVGESLHDWLTSEAGFPAWDVDFVELIPLFNTPTLKAVNDDETAAVYSFQARITYRD